MDIGDIITYVAAIPIFESRNDDDFASRLNHRFTVSILVVFSFVVWANILVGEKIECWAPAHFSDNHEAYTDSYCWAKNTYYLPYEENIPHEHEDDKRHMIQYYQWVPLILALQALLFYLPIGIWRHLNRRSGIDVDNVMKGVKECITEEDEDELEGKLLAISDNCERYLLRENEHTSCTMSLKSLCTRTCCVCCASRRGSYLVSLYLFVKFLFVVNVISQLFLLNSFLGEDYNMYGIEVLGHIASGTDWKGSRLFPKVTFCDLKVRPLGNVQRYTVQCVLLLNLLNEMIYLFVWFWMMFVAAVSVYSLLCWFGRALVTRNRVSFIKNNLYKKVSTAEDKRYFASFLVKFLKQDGIFILRLIDENANKIVMREVLDILWQRFRQKQLNMKKRREPEETGEGTLV